MVQCGLVRRKPRRPAGPRCRITASILPVKEHADPRLRSVTACHPAAPVSLPWPRGGRIRPAAGIELVARGERGCLGYWVLPALAVSVGAVERAVDPTQLKNDSRVPQTPLLAKEQRLYLARTGGTAQRIIEIFGPFCLPAYSQLTLAVVNWFLWMDGRSRTSGNGGGARVCLGAR